MTQQRRVIASTSLRMCMSGASIAVFVISQALAHKQTAQRFLVQK